MPPWLVTLLPTLTWLVFVIAFGGCVGSLINVLVYRLPRGISVVTPPSRCPACGTRLSWRDNIPVLGWLFLRGRCRYCRCRISPEYPAVEAFTAALFALFFAICFMTPATWDLLGLPMSGVRPDWARNPAELVWPTFAVLLVLLGSLIAATLVDLRTFTIPSPLTTWPAIVALLVHPIHAAWVEHGTRAGKLWFIPSQAWVWTIATPRPTDGWWIGASFGAAAGLVVSNLLLSSGLIRRSMEDYDEWERSVLGPDPAESHAPGPGSASSPRPEPAVPDPPYVAAVSAGLSAASGSGSQSEVVPTIDAKSGGGPVATPGPQPTPARPEAVGLLPDSAGGSRASGPSGPPADATSTRTPGAAAPGPARPKADAEAELQGSPAVAIGAVATVVSSSAGLLVAPVVGWPGGAGLICGMLAGPVIGGAAWAMVGRGRGRSGTGSPAESGPALPSEESPADVWIKYPHARREMFKELVFLAAPLVLGLAGGWVGDRIMGAGPASLWVTVLAGVLMGYVVGGGVVWAVRVLGSLAFGKEAMGLGDVHLMAAVGACLGWVDSVLAFFLASFVGLYWTVVAGLYSGGVRRSMPFGPYLAVATVVVLLAKPAVEVALARLIGSAAPIRLP